MKTLKSIILLITLTILISSCSKNPQACFEVSNANPYVDEEVVFTNCSLESDSYVWNFGDGTTSGEFETTHTYLTPGTYIVSLLAIAGEDNDHFVTRNIVVEDEPVILEEGKVVLWKEEGMQLDGASILLTFYCPVPDYPVTGTASEAFEFAPDCDTPGALTLAFPTDVNIGWQVTNTITGATQDRPAFSVTKDGCLQLKIGPVI